MRIRTYKNYLLISFRRDRARVAFNPNAKTSGLKHRIAIALDLKFRGHGRTTNDDRKILRGLRE